MSRAKWVLATAAMLLLAGCYEPASTYDRSRGRYVSTDDYKRDHGVKEVCRWASCWDDKAGRYLGADDWNRRREEEVREQ
jgi:hypothetical protein